MIDNIVPVSFQLERNGETKISANEYVHLMTFARTYVIGSGKSAYSFDLVHTTTGYVNIGTKNNSTVAVWSADSFQVKGVVADEKCNHFAEIEFKGKTFRIPFEALLPAKIMETLYSKGIAVSSMSCKVLSMHLQWLLGKFEVQDAQQVLGWKQINNELKWSGANTDPYLLQYKISETSEKAYIDKLNGFINDIPELQFVICAAIASTLLAYLSITEKIPVASFGVPLCYDESTINNDINKGNFVYTFVEGKDKLRLNQDSTLKKRNSWLCTALFSAETPFIDIAENDNLGLGVRMMNLENYVYTKNSIHSDEIKTFARLNYGIVGNLVSDYLLKADSAEIKKKFEEIKQAIAKEPELNKCSLTDRLLLNYALILQTSAILNELEILIDTDGIWRICIDNHNKISESAEPGKNAVIRLFNYIASNYKQLKGIKWTANKEGVPCYAYQFNMEKVNEAFGKINDDTFSNIKKYKEFSPFSDEVIEVVNDQEAIIHAGNYKIECNKTAVSGKAFLLL